MQYRWNLDCEVPSQEIGEYLLRMGLLSWLYRGCPRWPFHDSGSCFGLMIRGINKLSWDLTLKVERLYIRTQQKCYQMDEQVFWAHLEVFSENRFAEDWWDGLQCHFLKISEDPFFFIAVVQKNQEDSECRPIRSVHFDIGYYLSWEANILTALWSDVHPLPWFRQPAFPRKWP